MSQILMNLPKAFIEKLEKIVPIGIQDQVYQSFSLKKPTTFRVNLLKITIEELKEELTRQQINFRQVEWYPGAFILVDQPQSLLMETDLYKEGFIYIQNLSSMIPPLILEPQEDDKILDLTAAPGSKTTQIASMMNNTGQILANDTSRPRLYRLEANLKLQGVTNTKVTQLSGQIVWEKYPEYFDKTLIDAPCSMEGRFYTENPKTYRDWTSNKVKILATRQGYLLRSAISATKPGGIIVYSTCTLSPEENEGVIDWIIEKEGQNIEILETKIEGLPAYPGITEFGGKKYHSEVKKTLRIFPNDTMEGFFVAKIKKTRS